MDIKRIFINCMIILCVAVIGFSALTVIKRGSEPAKDTEITDDMEQNSEIIVKDTEAEVDTEVDSEEEPESTEQVVDVETSEAKKLYTTSKVNVRKGPATTYDAIKEIGIGVEVEAVGELDENGWQKILFDGQEAYILGRYLSDEKPAEQPANNQASANNGQSNNGNNNSTTNSNGQVLNAFGFIDPYGGLTPPPQSTTTQTPEATPESTPTTEPTQTPEQTPTTEQAPTPSTEAPAPTPDAPAQQSVETSEAPTTDASATPTTESSVEPTA